MRRKQRAGTEDRWHRDPRKGEQVPYPADAQKVAGTWCMDPKHGTTGTLVCTARHGVGRRWMARWVDGQGQERTQTFVRKGDATARVTQVTAELHTGSYVDSRASAATFGVVAEDWYAAKSPKLKPSTAAGYRSVLDCSLLPRWQDVPLAEITHADVQQWVTWMVTSKDARQPRSNDEERNGKRKPLSARRAVYAYGLLKQVLAYAIRTKRLAANPADDIELPRVVRRGDKALTHHQVAELAAAAGDAAAILVTLAYTGCRFGELASLRVGDVDLKRRRILVDKATTHVPGKGLVEDTTKTHQARSVPILTNELAETLRKVTEGRKPGEYLYPQGDGPMRNSYFTWRLKKACKSTGIEEVTPKTLRHTAGSLALNVGASVVTTQRLLGHESATTTLKVYSHMLPDDFDNLAAAMEKATAK